MEQAIDLGSAKYDERNLKLAHHASGFVQFSGPNILSGIAPKSGTIRGVGIQSFPLTDPIPGPTFGLVAREVGELDSADHIKGDVCTFTEADFAEPPRKDIVLEGFYLPEDGQAHIRIRPDGTEGIIIAHPKLKWLPLRVIRRSNIGGFIGLSLRNIETSGTPAPVFYLSGATGNIRRNEKGKKLGDGVFCMGPAPDDLEARDLNFLRKS